MIIGLIVLGAILYVVAGVTTSAVLGAVLGWKPKYSDDNFRAETLVIVGVFWPLVMPILLVRYTFKYPVMSLWWAVAGRLNPQLK